LHDGVQPGAVAVRQRRAGVIRAYTAGLERDDLSLSGLLIPFVPAQAGTQKPRTRSKNWVPASAATNGDWFNGSANLIHFALAPRLNRCPTPSSARGASQANRASDNRR